MVLLSKYPNFARCLGFCWTGTSVQPDAAAWG